MITVEASVYMINSDTSAKKYLNKNRFIDRYVRKITFPWIENLIKIYFPEFVINNSIIIINQTNTGYVATRSCTEPEVLLGFCFKNLEIVEK